LQRAADEAGPGGGEHVISHNVSFNNKLRGFDIGTPNTYTPN
jgi:hypothetical protein